MANWYRSSQFEGDMFEVLKNFEQDTGNAIIRIDIVKPNESRRNRLNKQLEEAEKHDDMDKIHEIRAQLNNLDEREREGNTMYAPSDDALIHFMVEFKKPYVINSLGGDELTKLMYAERAYPKDALEGFAREAVKEIPLYQIYKSQAGVFESMGLQVRWDRPLIDYIDEQNGNLHVVFSSDDKEYDFWEETEVVEGIDPISLTEEGLNDIVTKMLFLKETMIKQNNEMANPNDVVIDKRVLKQFIDAGVLGEQGLSNLYDKKLIKEEDYLSMGYMAIGQRHEEQEELPDQITEEDINSMFNIDNADENNDVDISDFDRLFKDDDDGDETVFAKTNKLLKMAVEYDKRPIKWFSGIGPETDEDWKQLIGFVSGVFYQGFTDDDRLRDEVKAELEEAIRNRDTEGITSSLQTMLSSYMQRNMASPKTVDDYEEYANLEHQEIANKVRSHGNMVSDIVESLPEGKADIPEQINGQAIRTFPYDVEVNAFPVNEAIYGTGAVVEGLGHHAPPGARMLVDSGAGIYGRETKNYFRQWQIFVVLIANEDTKRMIDTRNPNQNPEYTDWDKFQSAFTHFGQNVIANARIDVIEPKTWLISELQSDKVNFASRNLDTNARFNSLENIFKNWADILVAEIERIASSYGATVYCMTSSSLNDRNPPRGAGGRDRIAENYDKVAQRHEWPLVETKPVGTENGVYKDFYKVYDPLVAQAGNWYGLYRKAMD